MKTSKRTTVVGVFNDASKAQEAIRALKEAGFREDEIGVISQDKTAPAAKGKKTKGSHVAEGAVAGVATGAGVGALWALGIAANILPGIGPVIAGGLLASVLASAAGGAAVAGVVGALVGLGIPEEEAQYYEGEFKAGRTIVTVKANGRFDEAWSILNRFGAYNKETCHTEGARATATATAVGGDQTVEVREEELHARKTPVKKGEVRVRKEVVTEQQTLNVPVSHEEVVIERRPASRRASASASASAIKEGEEIRIPITEEKVRVEKDTVVKEEVGVRKRKVQNTEAVSGTVRKERVKVEQEGDVHVETSGASRNARR